jgi:hypothetical protein
MRERNSTILLLAHGLSFLMIIGDLHIKSVAVLPTKAEPAPRLASDPEALLALKAAGVPPGVIAAMTAKMKP